MKLGFSRQIFEKHSNIKLPGEGNGELSLRTCPGCSAPEPYQWPHWTLVSAQTGPRAEYQQQQQQ